MQEKIEEQLLKEMFQEIATIITKNKEKMIYQINTTLVTTYFQIGKVIVEKEQNGKLRAEYGKEVLKNLSKRLTKEFGTGFGLSGLYNMRLFYNRYQKSQPLVGKLSWSHYCYLIYIEDDDERNFYEKECINEKWSKRELKRQMDAALYQRLLLQKGSTNKKKIYELAKVGQTISKPIDILKEPYVFEFLGLPENKKIMESDLEKSL